MLVPLWVATATTGQDVAMQAALADVEAGQIQALVNDGFANEGGTRFTVPPNIAAALQGVLVNLAARAPAIHNYDSTEDNEGNETGDDWLALGAYANPLPSTFGPLRNFYAFKKPRRSRRIRKVSRLRHVSVMPVISDEGESELSFHTCE